MNRKPQGRDAEGAHWCYSRIRFEERIGGEHGSTGKNGTVAEFERKTGVDVKYVEDINDNSEFFGKMQSLLAKGESGGRA
jgi:hypothetical protein